MTDRELPPPDGYLKGANDYSLNHSLRWKISGAVVEQAKRIIDGYDASGDGPEFDGYQNAQRAIWEWDRVGEVFARYLIFGLKIDDAASDDDILKAVSENWDHVMGGMPPKE